MSIDHIIERLRAYRHSRGWSILRFAKEAGMGESTIRNMDRADWSPTADTIRRLEAVIPPEWVRTMIPTTGPAPVSSLAGGATPQAGSAEIAPPGAFSSKEASHG